MKKTTGFLISTSIFLMLVIPNFSFAKDAIKVISSSISSQGLNTITVYVSNPNPQNLKLRAEYGEGDFGLKSNTFYFNGSGRGTAALTALRAGQVYQYRLFDTTGVLNPSDTYSFSTSAGSVTYQSYPFYGGSISGNPIPSSPPPYYTGSPNTPSTPPGSTAPGANATETYDECFNREVAIDGNAQRAQDKCSGVSPNGSPTGATPNALGGTPTSPTAGSTITPTFTSASAYDPNASGLIPSPSSCDTSVPPKCTWGFKDFLTLINNVIRFILFVLVVPIAAIMFFYAGFKLVTSGGSAEAKGKAKNVFSSAVIGVIVAVGAWLIIRTILTILGYDGVWIGFPK